MLLKNGANNILRPIDKDHSVLFKAIVENDHIEIINILDNEESNINTKEIYSYTPLHFAANYGNYFIVALLTGNIFLKLYVVKSSSHKSFNQNLICIRHLNSLISKWISACFKYMLDYS